MRLSRPTPTPPPATTAGVSTDPAGPARAAKGTQQSTSSSAAAHGAQPTPASGHTGSGPLNAMSGQAAGALSALAIRAGAVQAGHGCGEVKPLMFSKHNGPAVDFPLTAEGAQALQNSNAVSPFLATDPRVVVSPDFLPVPTNPGDPGFWDEFEQVVDLQHARRAGGDAARLMDLPALFATASMDEAAAAVRADFPSKWPTALVEQFLGEGAKIDPSIIPQKSQADFVNGPVLLSRVIGWAVSEVSPSAFATKWARGRARPEGVAWAIHTGELDAPQHIKDKVAALNLSAPEDFTAYGEGCPRHPSYPAMHSAASSASLYLAVLMDLSPEQLDEARKLDAAVATFRSMAGVHYDTDNRAGLALGQEVIARQLPDYLAQFGADPDVVRAKIERVRLDWLNPAETPILEG